MMNKQRLLYSLVLVTILSGHQACAQTKDNALHVVKTDINAESENAELCVEFDKPLAPASPAHLASALHLESDGKAVAIPSIAAAGTSLCVFPLARGTQYHLTLSGLRGSDDERLDESYKTTFTIPDHTATLSFTGANGGVNGFDFYDTPLTLRAVNVPHVKIDIYRVSDAPSLARAWIDRAQTALAPTESAYLAHDKGQAVWHGDVQFDVTANTTSTQQIALRDKAPDLAPGLYLIVADAENHDASKPASKGLAPLAAAWFTRADFSMQALRDDKNLHVFVTRNDNAAKDDIIVNAINSKGEPIATGKITGDANTDVITLPAAVDSGDAVSLIGTDSKGGIGFADSDKMPLPKTPEALGTIHAASDFVAPFDNIETGLSLAAADSGPKANEASLLRLTQKESDYATIAVPPLAPTNIRLSFAAPATQGLWAMRWQKNDGTMLATKDIHISDNADLPHLEVTSHRDALGSDGVWPVTIRSVTQAGQAAPLIGGHVSLVWQKMDTASLGWKDYVFGTVSDVAETPVPVGDFITDLQGMAQLHLALPAHPTDHGLYQAKLRVTADADTGVGCAAPVILPLRPDATIIGIKALTTAARFPQNGIARFALIGIDSDDKPHDVGNLSYQLYEEGRSFSWFQDEGKWNYKQAAQLRPIGGGALAIKADGSSILEWPVTAGNYRLEILDPNGKTLAQTSFSAGWDSTGASAVAALPLDIALPKILLPNHEAAARSVLPEASMVTFVVGDGHIRKTIHEYRAKGDNNFTFVPASDWQENITVSLAAQPISNPALQRAATGEALLTQNRQAIDNTAATLSLIASDDPAALVLHKGGSGLLSFALVNNGTDTETYHYNFGLSAGLKAESEDKGSLTIAAGQSKPLSLALSANQTGVKEIRLDITGSRASHISRSWPLSVALNNSELKSVSTKNVEGKQILFSAPAKQDAAETLMFVSRRPMDGLAEILSFAVHAQPFTTTRLASNLEALRLWRGVIAETGLMHDFAVDAKRRALFIQMLRHQNTDGGFAPYRGTDSTLTDTAAALTALGKETSPQTDAAKKLAITYIQQRLANTWVDETERAPRAYAYAALAAADAVDIASLHYFSDTSATLPLPAIAEAHIAAAFKQVRDPNAAAFWIKKMLDENPGQKNIELLNALADTDALSSDDVHAAMLAMKNDLQKNIDVPSHDAALLLRAIAADNIDAGKAHWTAGNESHDINNVGVIRGAGETLASYRNGDATSLSMTLIGEETKTLAAPTNITRHIYRLNGVEIAPPARLVRGENYIVELKGTYPVTDIQMLVQDTGMRPMGCPLSARTNILSFMPWLDTHGLTDSVTCEFTHHEMNILLPASDTKDAGFSTVYFAHSDETGLGNLPPPRLRALKSVN